MSRTDFEMNCGLALWNMDLYLDRELGSDTRQDIMRHIDECRQCAREMRSRAELRSRLKTAVNSVPASGTLEARVRASLRTAAHRGRPTFFARMALPVAAMLAIGIGLAITYQLGHLRLTTASQEAYITSISQHVPGLMRVGLGDHVHCTVFRKYPKNPPSFAKMSEDLGPAYKDLLPVVNENLSPGYRVVMGHRCSYHRRKFVHLAMTNGSHLISLVVAMRGAGETFESSKVASMLADRIPMYRASVQRFSIAAFETGVHVVYVVSDLKSEENTNTLAALTPGIRTALARVERAL